MPKTETTQIRRTIRQKSFARLVPAKTRAFVDWLAGKMAEAPWSEGA